jgi:hypothetical protein
MSLAGLAIVLAAALVLLGIVLNHVYARVALVEIALNEGLPPGHQRVTASSLTVAVAPTTVAARLGRGVHIFLSRSCHACQRLIEELEGANLSVGLPIAFHYVDRPRPIARSVATTLGASLSVDEAELATEMLADPLPYTIGIGDHGLVTRGVTPTLRQVLDVARDAGATAREVRPTS